MSVFDTGIYKAVEKAGSVAALAAAIGVKRQAVYPWLTRGWVPAPRAVQIEKVFGIPRKDLMSADMHALLSDSDNEAAQAGDVRYTPRKAPASTADDLV